MAQEAMWREFPLKLFSHDSIMQQPKDKQAVYYVWPDEGDFKKTKFHFHKGQREPKNEAEAENPIDYPTVPMLIDMSSANAYRLVYEAISEKNQKSMRGKCESARWWTGYIIGDVCWNAVSFGGR